MEAGVERYFDESELEWVPLMGDVFANAPGVSEGDFVHEPVVVRAFLVVGDEAKGGLGIDDEAW